MKRSEVTPDDVIVVKSPKPLGPYDSRNIEKRLEELFGTNKILFLEDGIEIEVIKPVSTFIQQVEDALEKK